MYKCSTGRMRKSVDMQEKIEKPLDRLVGGLSLDEDKREIIREARQELTETRNIQIIKAGK